MQTNITLFLEESGEGEGEGLLEQGHFVVVLFYVLGKHLRSCRDGQLT